MVDCPARRAGPHQFTAEFWKVSRKGPRSPSFVDGVLGLKHGSGTTGTAPLLAAGKRELLGVVVRFEDLDQAVQCLVGAIALGTENYLVAVLRTE